MTEQQLIEFFRHAIECQAFDSTMKFETEYWEGNFFLVKQKDKEEIFEITVVGNIDPGAWED